MLRVTFVTLYLSAFCYGISQGQFGPQKYEIEEEPSKQTLPFSTRTIIAPRPAYDQNQQLNQYYLGQQTQAQTQAQPQPQHHQYLAALQQYYAASRQPQNAYQTAPQTQNYAQPSQQNYPQPLGVLYSAASDVSQFQFSGNGINYSF